MLLLVLEATLLVKGGAGYGVAAVLSAAALLMDAARRLVGPMGAAS